MQKFVSSPYLLRFFCSASFYFSDRKGYAKICQSPVLPHSFFSKISDRMIEESGVRI
ncbi:MAG: hypothetical protein SWX82_35810 [Cyanobacteriota bacterium]|nr:hypothetical protein [Cyanobacteriota bacterium]